MAEQKISIEEYKNTVERIFAESKSQYTKKQTSRGTTYSLTKDNIHLEITLGTEWIGYDLSFAKEELGKSLGVFSDTDNYPLDGDNAKVSEEIYKELLVCLEAFLRGNIYTGHVKGKPALAVPIDKNQFKLATRGKFFMASKTINFQELEKLGLRTTG